MERKFSEPTCRHLLRKPLIFGVPAVGLMFLAAVTLSLFIFLQGSMKGDCVTVAIAAAGYIGLRMFQAWSRVGWEEILIFRLEEFLERKKSPGRVGAAVSEINSVSPDTLNETALIFEKDLVAEQLESLSAGERRQWICSVKEDGAKVQILHRVQEGVAPYRQVDQLGLDFSNQHIYSLFQLPVKTDPLWLFAVLSRIPAPFDVIFSAKGVESSQIKRKLEGARKANSRTGGLLTDIDADVTFEETSQVLQGLSRGEERVVEVSVTVFSKEPLKLDGEYFVEEIERELALFSSVGLRKRFFRSHLVRIATACDLFPSILDPKEHGAAILKTLRGAPLYFSPQDPRLEALHWLVVGASGSGKSFFTGLVIKRMIDAGEPLSVLFVDHNRSFRRIVRDSGAPYFEPSRVHELDASHGALFESLNRVGSVAGVELSDLPLDEKKAGAKTILSAVEAFLRSRETTHPIYVVLDECWNFMRDEPVLVQRAFREFRKLNGAVVAITQSLSDFLTDQSGQSIFQNAPIRVLLRQGEDVSRYQGILGLNDVELSRVKRLKQKKGVYSECLIQTPFLSRLGRLYPSDAEHALLRTDNLREELISEARASRRSKVSKEVIAC